jgi:hypothetical protein
MTIKTWRKELLKVCKYCKYLYDRGGNRYRYQCTKFECHINEANKCGKTRLIRKQASEVSKKALQEAFYNLTGKQMPDALKESRS